MGSRYGSGSRAAMRGGGGRGRGGRRDRGRGRDRDRGRARGRGGGHNQFNASRIAERYDEAENKSESERSSENETGSDQAEEDDEEPKKREAYLRLMESFASRIDARSAKRRKLDNGDAVRQEAAVVAKRPTLAKECGDDDEEDDGESEQDEPDVSDNGRGGGDLGREKDVDFVDEEEEADDDISAEKDGDGDDDDEQLDAADPFESHFAPPDEGDVARRITAIQNEEWSVSKVTANKSRLIFTVPQTGAAKSTFSPPAPVAGCNGLKLKQRLADALAASKKPEFDPVEQKVAPLLFNYYDLLYCERNPDNGKSLRRIASLHAVNHVFKTRDRVIKNNEKLAKAARKRNENERGDNEVLPEENNGEEEAAYRDQGFTRPKVLMLLPTREACVRMVDAICAVCQPEQQENRKRFEDAYMDKDASVPEDRPADFRDLFDGNDDDMFRLGLKFTRKTVKYFSQFYNSDIILASPLGLRMAMGSEDALGSSLSAKSKKDKPNTDYDFLSSVELVLLDQADALLMQNWEHVEHIFGHLNRRPRDSHDYDISRLRPWYLDEQAANYRQTVVFSAFHTPALAELFRRFCHNWAGKVRIQPAEYAGVVGRLGVRGVKQTFSRFISPAVEADPDARFDYFTKAVVPALVSKGRGGSVSTSARTNNGVLVFIPSYLDFVRVRNWFATAAAVANVSFGTVSEYSSVPEASRAISHFLTGRHRVLLYTERAHHFRRHQINGVRTVILYGLPENPLFYTEITGGYLGRSQRSQKLEPGHGRVRAMFSQYDVFKLERVVGSQRIGQMIRERSDTFVFEEEREL